MTARFTIQDRIWAHTAGVDLNDVAPASPSLQAEVEDGYAYIVLLKQSLMESEERSRKQAAEIREWRYWALVAGLVVIFAALAYFGPAIEKL